MRRGLFLVAGILALAVFSLAQQTVMRSPNGVERWKKGEYQEIKWGCVQCTGTAELHLVRDPQRTIPGGITATRSSYQTLGVIKTAVAVNPGSQFYSYNWRVGDYIGGTAPLGDGYKILVKVVLPNGTVSDISDSSFVIGAPPTIDYFAINDGLSVTNQRRVTLNYRFTGFPSPGSYRVRCTPQPGTPGAWLPLAAGVWPTYELPMQSGDYTIELSLGNDIGLGPSKTDTIRYEVAPTTQDYTVAADEIACKRFADMNPAWYSCRCTYYDIKPSPDNCFCGSWGVCVKANSQVLGNKVEYEFFGGRQLNPGWSFVSIDLTPISCLPKTVKGEMKVLVMPQVGSRNIMFKVRLWIEGGSISTNECWFWIKSLVIRGPVDRPVSEAFK